MEALPSAVNAETIMPVAASVVLIKGMRAFTDQATLDKVAENMLQQRDILSELRDAINESLKSVRRIRNDVAKLKLTADRSHVVKTIG